MITLIFIVGSVGFISGYLRLITDEAGNIPLNSYRLTGCFPAFLYGMFEGTRDLCSRQLTNEALSAILVYGGIGLYFLGFNLPQ
ncbi:MAG: hypothetical protein AAFO95_19385 [Cyanobacteria bacterium J06600_6]